jgi:predicted nucleic acid-binding protein
VATYLPDTSVIIDALNGKLGRRELLLGLVNQGHLLACCPINVTEVYAGLRPTEESATEELLRSLEYYNLTWPVARLASLLKRDYRRKGATLTVADATIAAGRSCAWTHADDGQCERFPDEGVEALFPS